ncbi:NADH-quinone oxidoreductase subunit A [bacterium]|nr:NADH-quinone oxidoreductase subunit A [bacterium]
MLFEFSNVAIFLIIAVVFVLVVLSIGKLLRPDNPSPGKSAVYECGEPPVGSGYSQFNMRFYLIAFVFVIFDVEIAFMFPVTVVFRELLEKGMGILAFVEITIFIVILLVGFVYAWTQGGLDWVRNSEKAD